MIEKITRMLKDIIDNNAEYEYRELCGECNYKKEDCDLTCTLTNRLWNPYHLGEVIRSDCEYRKIYFVQPDYTNGYTISFKKSDHCKVFFQRFFRRM